MVKHRSDLLLQNLEVALLMSMLVTEHHRNKFEQQLALVTFFASLIIHLDFRIFNKLFFQVLQENTWSLLKFVFTRGQLHFNFVVVLLIFRVPSLLLLFRHRVTDFLKLL